MRRLHAIFYGMEDIRDGFNSESYSSSSAREISRARDYIPPLKIYDLILLDETRLQFCHYCTRLLYVSSNNPASKQRLEKTRYDEAKGTGKAVSLQAWSGPEGSRKLRFPDFMTTAEDGGKVVRLTHRPHLTPGNSPGTHFC
jgi:hypothetical protein